MQDKPYLKLFTFFAIGISLTFATWWLVANHRKASSNSEQLIGRWKLLSGGFDRSENLDLRGDGTMTTSTEVRGKQTIFDGRYRVGSRHVTLTVLVDRHSGMDEDDEPERQQAVPVKSESGQKKPKVGVAHDEPPELEDVQMQILSMSKNEVVIAEANGRRMIYVRM